jgi:predicted DNA-binding protein
MVKMTFTVDDATAARLRQCAQRLAMPQSAIVREAIHDYADRAGRLSEPERVRRLRVFDELLPNVPARPAADVDRELAEITRGRRGGGRRGRSR